MNNLIIFSTDRPDAFYNLEDPRFYKIIGSYKGQVERSYLAGLSLLNEVIEIAKKHNQESILVIEAGYVYLLMLDDMSKVSLGTEFAQVNRPFTESYSIIDNMFYEVI